MPESAFEVLVRPACRLVASTRDGAEAYTARSSSKQANIFISLLIGWILFSCSLEILLLHPPLGLHFTPQGAHFAKYINQTKEETSGPGVIYVENNKRVKSIGVFRGAACPRSEDLRRGRRLRIERLNRGRREGGDRGRGGEGERGGEDEVSAASVWMAAGPHASPSLR